MKRATNRMALIIVSGIYIAYREIVNARRSILPTVEGSFAPGNPGVVPDGHEIDPGEEKGDGGII